MSDFLGLVGSSSLPSRHIGGLFIRLFIAELMRHQATVNREINAIGRDHARQVQTIQKELVPVDTGNLRRSITIDSEMRSDEPDVWKIGPDLEYGRFVEYGTSRQDPQPFVGPSGDAVIDRYHEAIKRITFKFWD